MRASKEIDTLQAEVKTLLTKYPKYREDDRLLTCGLWATRVGGKDMLKRMTAFEFLTKYANENLPNHDSITRASRKIKEDYPELRGKNYKAKQEEMNPVKEVLGYHVDKY